MSLANMIRAIQRACTENNGAYVYYSQAMEPTATLIEMLPYTEGGICNALSAKWIEQHANGGSLWNWLFAPGTTRVQQSSIINLMVNFTESTVRTRHDIDKSVGSRRKRKKIAKRLVNQTAAKAFTGGDYQEFVTDKYMLMYGLKRRRIAQSWIAGSIGNCINWGYGPKTGIELASRMQPKWMVTKSGTYAIINVLGDDGGHAMAAWIGEDIAFFDPNFGEFYFSNPRDFQNFFRTFWDLSDYDEDFDRFCFFLYSKGV